MSGFKDFEDFENFEIEDFENFEIEDFEDFEIEDDVLTEYNSTMQQHYGYIQKYECEMQELDKNAEGYEDEDDIWGTEYVDNVERSNETGWYYSDNDDEMYEVYDEQTNKNYMLPNGMHLDNFGDDIYD